MVTNSRFPFVAYWAAKQYTENNQVIGATVKTVAFRCVENILKRKTSSSSTEGATATAATIELRTDEKVGELIEPDDSVSFGNDTYSVADVYSVRSISGLHAKEYIIALR
jgi:hypothetical protein